MLLFCSRPDATALLQVHAGDQLAPCRVSETCVALNGAREKDAILNSPIAAQTMTAAVNSKRRTTNRFMSATAKH